MNKTGANIANKTSLVRRRRLLRTMRCDCNEIIQQIQFRIEKLTINRKHIEVIIREKEESLRSIQFYEENRAYVYEQSLNLATQGTVGTLTVLKELFIKLKRLYQVLFCYYMKLL